MPGAYCCSLSLNTGCTHYDCLHCFSLSCHAQRRKQGAMIKVFHSVYINRFQGTEYEGYIFKRLDGDGRQHGAHFPFLPLFYSFLFLQLFSNSLPILRTESAVAIYTMWSKPNVGLVVSCETVTENTGILGTILLLLHAAIQNCYSLVKRRFALKGQ